MKQYESFLRAEGFNVNYIEAISELADVRALLIHLKENGVEHIHYIDPTDDWLAAV